MGEASIYRPVLALTVVAFLLGCLWALHQGDSGFSGSGLSGLRDKLSSTDAQGWSWSEWGWPFSLGKEDIKETSVRLASDGALRSSGRKGTMRENLREDKNYIISFYGGGFNNQVLEIMYLLDVARRTGRIPILPSFEPALSQEGMNATWLSPDKVFNLTATSQALGFPIVTLHELKLFKEEPAYWDRIYRNRTDLGYTDKEGFDGDWEDIGCWSVWYRQRAYFRLNPTNTARLSVHYKPVPEEAVPGYQYIDLSKVIPLLDPSNPPITSLTEEETQFMHNHGLPLPVVLPDNHLACVDTLFWAAASGGDFELDVKGNNGSWRDIGPYLTFNDDLLDLADDYVRATLGIKKKEPIPPYIVAHIRRADYVKRQTTYTIDHTAYVIDVLLQKAKAEQRIEVDPKNTIILTDESDPEWLAGLYRYGFKIPDHTDTIIKYGAWYPTFIDVVIMSRSSLFVGNKFSTMSVMAAGRVAAWQKGYFAYPADYIEAYNSSLAAGWEWPWPVDA